MYFAFVLSCSLLRCAVSLAFGRLPCFSHGRIAVAADEASRIHDRRRGGVLSQVPSLQQSHFEAAAAVTSTGWTDLRALM